MPIRDIQRFVELTGAGDHTIDQRVTVLKAHRDSLAEQLALLTRHFAAIENKIGVHRALLDDHEQTKEYVRRRPNSDAPVSGSASLRWAA